MQFSISFFVTALVILGLIGELYRFRDRAWALPALLVYLTVLVWYYADFVLYGEKYREFAPILIDYAYGEVLIFVLAFRLLTPYYAQKLELRKPFIVPKLLKPESVFVVAVVAWAFLFLCAVYRMDWDVMGALFPVTGRNGNLMWLRAAAGDAGPTGFLVSSGGYLYMLTCAFFGILFAVMRRLPYKIAAAGMIALTWPFFMLCGTRNQFLAVSMPWVFCYALLGRQKVAIRMTTLVLCFLFVNFAFQIVVGYRNVGFKAFFEEDENELMVEGMDQTEKASGHQGLNMLEELCFENIFLSTGQSRLTWGWDYFVQATGFVPRAIWPNKPMMGIDYAKARGFGGADSDIGVFATVSTGLIGQGVLEFGPFFGPMAPAFLLAIWCGLLGRWWQQRASLLRLGLCLVALGITFNLGRNITNIALWPVMFAYLLVRWMERSLQSRLALPQNVRFKEKARPARVSKLLRRLPAARPADLAVLPPDHPSPLPRP